MCLQFASSEWCSQELWEYQTCSFLLQSFSRCRLQADALFNDQSLPNFLGLAVKLHFLPEALLEFESHLIHQILQIFLLAEVLEFVDDCQDELVTSCQNQQLLHLLLLPNPLHDAIFSLSSLLPQEVPLRQTQHIVHVFLLFDDSADRACRGLSVLPLYNCMSLFSFGIQYDWLLRISWMIVTKSLLLKVLDILRHKVFGVLYFFSLSSQTFQVFDLFVDLPDFWLNVYSLVNALLHLLVKLSSDLLDWYGVSPTILSIFSDLVLLDKVNSEVEGATLFWEELGKDVVWLPQIFVHI